MEVKQRTFLIIFIAWPKQLQHNPTSAAAINHQPSPAFFLSCTVFRDYY